VEGMRLLRSLRLQNILSYGPVGAEIELLPLNVFIGPNGSGKSNLIEAISLLKAARLDVLAPIRRGGGISHWLWKGVQGATPATLAVETLAQADAETLLRYRLQLSSVYQTAEVSEEVVEREPLTGGAGSGSLCHRHHDGSLEMTSRTLRGALGMDRRPKIDRDKSVFAEVRDFVNYPEITYLGTILSRISLFRSAGIGRESAVRGPQRADETAAFLLEDGRNLGVVLSELLGHPALNKDLVTQLRWMLPWVENVTTGVVAGTVEIMLHERGLDASIPSIRLSDGTLRYLCLLVVLLHHSPPPLICIEDPEIGLHPDILPRLAELLVDASQRMQLIVTTHSDILVSALSHVPEAVVVCERDQDGTHLRRLDAASLEEWLKKYSLGDLWVSGEIGGTT